MEASGIDVRAELEGETATLRISGTRIANVDVRLLEQCASALMACADRNACFDRGLSITEHCISTIANHDRELQCVSKGFGFAQAGR